MKRAKKWPTQSSLARILVRKYVEMEGRMEQLMNDNLAAMECGYQDEYQFNFIIQLVHIFSKVDDHLTQKRVISC